jgi:hypothetical protein
VFECPFLTNKRIDSFQKLGLVRWLYARGCEEFTVQELTDALFVADLSLLERSLNELSATGLVECGAGWYRMVHSPEADYCMDCLSETFKDPLARQALLDCVSSLGGGYDVRPG